MSATADGHDLFGSGGANNAYDIAVIVLDDPVDGIVPARRPTAGLLDELHAQHILTQHTFTAVAQAVVTCAAPVAGRAFVSTPGC